MEFPKIHGIDTYMPFRVKWGTRPATRVQTPSRYRRPINDTEQNKIIPTTLCFISGTKRLTIKAGTRSADETRWRTDCRDVTTVHCFKQRPLSVILSVCLYHAMSFFPRTTARVLCVADTSYSYHPAIHDDTFVRRKQRRNRTTFTLQQVRNI
jgi:hypothetical protein